MTDATNGAEVSKLETSSGFDSNSKQAFFRRLRGCPLKGVAIDYKNVKLVSKYISEGGKMLARRITGVDAKKQRELNIAINRCRILALLPFAQQ